MTTPEEENNKPQDNNNNKNEKSLYDRVQYEPFEIPEFFTGCFMFGFITIFITISLSLIMSRFMDLMENMKYLPIIIIIIVNFFCARYSFIAGRKSYGYGIITATILILLLTGPCFLYSNN